MEYQRNLNGIFIIWLCPPVLKHGWLRNPGEMGWMGKAAVNWNWVQLSFWSANFEHQRYEKLANGRLLTTDVLWIWGASMPSSNWHVSFSLFFCCPSILDQRDLSSSGVPSRAAWKRPRKPWQPAWRARLRWPRRSASRSWGRGLTLSVWWWFGFFMSVKQGHKPPIWEWFIYVYMAYTTYLWLNWGMIYYCLPCLTHINQLNMGIWWDITWEYIRYTLQLFKHCWEITERNDRWNGNIIHEWCIFLPWEQRACGLTTSGCYWVPSTLTEIHLFIPLASKNHHQQ